MEINRSGNWHLTGALCRVERTGMYVQINAGSIRSLPQREVRGLLGDSR